MEHCMGPWISHGTLSGTRNRASPSTPAPANADNHGRRCNLFRSRLSQCFQEIPAPF